MTDLATSVRSLLHHLTQPQPLPAPTHLRAVDRCYTDPADAHEHARRMLAIIEGRPPHRVEVEAAVVVCPWGSSCSSQARTLRRIA